MPPTLSVIVPTHRPHAGRLQRTLAGLRRQTLPASDWELLVIDNASPNPIDDSALAAGPVNQRVVREEELGLTSARRRGFAEARGDFAVLVDDDNELAADYLAQVLALFARHTHVGLLGGKVVPEYEVTPPAWAEPFRPLLALRDLGNEALISHGLRPTGTGPNVYPACAPVGAGMALRRAAWQAWLDRAGSSAISDRRGNELTSSGDNDIVLAAMRLGWEVAYFPELSLTHLIPAGRLEAEYLARLSYGTEKSWMRVLTRHEANPWPPLTAIGARLRMAKAWLRLQPWRNPAARIRWRGACGHFAGRVAVDAGR